MSVTSAMLRYGLALAVVCLATVLAWLSAEPSACFLVAITVAHLYGGRGPGLLSVGLSALAFDFLFLPPRFDLSVESVAYFRFAAFVLASLFISLVIQSKQGADRARRAERETRLIVESMPGLGWSTDADGTFTYVNPSAMEYLGVPREDLDRIAGSDAFGWQQVVHPDDVDHAVKGWRHCLQTGEPYESVHRVRRFDGTYRWFRAAGRPSRDRNGRVTGWYGTTIDIDDQKKAQDALRVSEEALRKSEQQLRLLIDTIPALVWCATADGERAYTSNRTLSYFGMEHDDPAEPRFNMVHRDDAQQVARAWMRSLRTGQSFSSTHRLRRADGEYRWHEARAEALRDEAGNIVQWYGVNVDVDDRQRAEEALRKIAQQRRLIIDTIPALVWCATPEGEPSYINKPLMDYIGLTLEDLDRPGSTRLAEAISSVVHPDDAPTLRRYLSHSFRTGESFAMRHRLRRADGVYRWVDGRAEPLRDEDGHIVQWYGVNVDIDEETRTQAALRSAQDKLTRASQLAGLAEMSASIAHEINQPLASVVTHGFACQRWLSAEPPNLERARFSADRIIRDGNAAADIVGRIRALFRRSPVDGTLLDLNDVIAEVCRLLSDEGLRKDIRIEVDLEANLPPIIADRTQIQQVLINLARNGMDAMEHTVEPFKALFIRSHREDTNTILIEVRDHGCGLADVDVFEPFVTTKTEGMGMGLPICRSIVEAHDGRLWAVRNEGKGTTFSFTLPVKAGEAADA